MKYRGRGANWTEEKVDDVGSTATRRPRRFVLDMQDSIAFPKTANESASSEIPESNVVELKSTAELATIK
jgi:hypothetical protein